MIHFIMPLLHFQMTSLQITATLNHYNTNHFRKFLLDKISMFEDISDRIMYQGNHPLYSFHIYIHRFLVGPALISVSGNVGLMLSKNNFLIFQFYRLRAILSRPRFLYPKIRSAIRKMLFGLWTLSLSLLINQKVSNLFRQKYNSVKS